METKRSKDERRRGTDETVVCTESDRGEMPRTESAVDGFGRTVVRLEKSNKNVPYYTTYY